MFGHLRVYKHKGDDQLISEQMRDKIQNLTQYSKHSTQRKYVIYNRNIQNTQLTALKKVNNTIRYAYLQEAGRLKMNKITFKIS